MTNIPHKISGLYTETPAPQPLKRINPDFFRGKYDETFPYWPNHIILYYISEFLSPHDKSDIRSETYSSRLEKHSRLSLAVNLIPLTSERYGLPVTKLLSQEKK